VAPRDGSPDEESWKAYDEVWPDGLKAMDKVFSSAVRVGVI
jgi:hypothetical protein